MSNAGHIGKTVLVGITQCDEAGNALSFSDFFGVVEEADDMKGVLLRLTDGSTYNLPPIPLDDYIAKHDFYEMESRPEVVEPDFVVMFDVTPPRKH